MILLECPACRRKFAEQPAYCRCGSQEFQTLEVAGGGRVYSCTTLFAAAEAFEKDLPFQIAIVELEDGFRLTARITGPRVEIGDTVKFLEPKDGVHLFSAA